MNGSVGGPFFEHLDAAKIDLLPRKYREEVLALLEEQQRRISQNKILTYYPDTGPSTTRAARSP